MTPTTIKALGIIKLLQSIISVRDGTIEGLQVEKEAAKAQVTSLAIENERLRCSTEAIETQVKVLRKTLQLQLEPKVSSLRG
jgi:hypothetical protein